MRLARIPHRISLQCTSLTELIVEQEHRQVSRGCKKRRRTRNEAASFFIDPLS
jgi:hypothetical protein